MESAVGRIEPVVDSVPGRENERRDAFRPVPVSDFVAREAQPYLAVRLLRRRELAMLFGHPGAGKSFVALDFALRLASGLPIWATSDAETSGFLTVASTVIYVTNEGVDDFELRIRAWLQKERESDEAPEPRLFVVEDMVRRDNMEGFIAAARDLAPDLVIIDPLAHAMGDLDENSASGVTEFLDAIDQIRRELGCAVMLVHHSTKSGGSYRGSSALAGRVDLMIACERRGDEPNTTILKFEKCKGFAAPADLEIGFGSVDLGVDPHDPLDRPLTSLHVASVSRRTGVDPAGSSSSARDEVLLGPDDRVLSESDVEVLLTIRGLAEAAWASPSKIRESLEARGVSQKDPRRLSEQLRRLRERSLVRTNGKKTHACRYQLTETCHEWLEHRYPLSGGLSADKPDNPDKRGDCGYPFSVVRPPLKGEADKRITDNRDGSSAEPASEEGGAVDAT